MYIEIKPKCRKYHRKSYTLICNWYVASADTFIIMVFNKFRIVNFQMVTSFQAINRVSMCQRSRIRIFFSFGCPWTGFWSWKLERRFLGGEYKHSLLTYSKVCNNVNENANYKTWFQHGDSKMKHKHRNIYLLLHSHSVQIWMSALLFTENIEWFAFEVLFTLRE